MDEKKPKRRWLSFGIRDLLWAMVVVGLVIGWWVDRSQLKESMQTASYNYAWASNIFNQLGWKQHYKDGRIWNVEKREPSR